MMPRRGENIYKRNDGRWEARYVKEIMPDGSKKYGSVYAHSYREVKEKQLFYLNNPQKQFHSMQNITISMMSELWLESIKNSVKINTHRKYEGLCSKYIMIEIGNISVKQITADNIRSFVNVLISYKLSNQTINDILTVLSLIFRYAEEEYQIPPVRITYLKVKKHEMRVFSKEEQLNLVAYLTDRMDIYKFGVLLALFSGIRIGELCALTWSDINDESIIINKTMYRTKGEESKTTIKVGTPKTESSDRKIPTPRLLLPYIKEFRNDGYMLSTDTLAFCEPRLMQIKFKKMLDESGIEKATFHTLRHTFATRCIEAGVDVKTLSEILGHSDVKTTLNRYVHSSFELKQRSMERLENSLI